MAKRTWDLEENPKNSRWYLKIANGADIETYPTVQEIRERASEKGIDPLILQSDASLEKNIAKARAIAGEEFSFPVVIEPTFDVRLIVTPDKTSAELYIRKSSDKKNDLDLKLISSVINNSHLVGLDAEKIKNAINEFRVSPTMELNDFVLTEGVPPGRGKDRELIAQVDWYPEDKTGELCSRLGEYFRQAAISDGEKIFFSSKKPKIAPVEKDAVLYTLSPVEYGTQGRDVFGKSISGLPGNDPFFQILENVSLGPAGIKAEKCGLLVDAEFDGVRRIRVIPYTEGKATAFISPDNMTASLILESDDGAGNPLSVDMAKAAIAQKRIKGNIDENLIPEAVAEVRATKKSIELVILRGTKPVLPGAFRINMCVDSPETGKPVQINAGDRILSMQKVTAGADGIDVFGNVLKASSARQEETPEHDDSISEETVKDEVCFTAKISGELMRTGAKFWISDKKEINGDIDDESGNIDFPGNLVLSGNVKSGHSVKASGTLLVNGNADASLIASGVSVTMTGGIRGDGRGTAWAKQEVHLNFAENACLLAGQDIAIDNYCFQCIVKTNGMLLMKGTPGVLLGGSIRASKGVEVFELGSEKTIRTSISFGQNYLVSDQIEVCEREVDKLKAMVDKIDAEMKRTSTTDPRIHELRRKKLEMLKRNDKLTVRIFTLKEQFETHIISHIKVEGTVYPGVILESHGRYYEVREQKKHVIFTFDQRTGQITCSPIPTNQE